MATQCTDSITNLFTTHNALFLEPSDQEVHDICADNNGAALKSQLERISQLCASEIREFSYVMRLFDDILCFEDEPAEDDGLPEYCLAAAMQIIPTSEILADLFAGTGVIGLNWRSYLEDETKRDMVCRSKRCTRKVVGSVSTAARGIAAANNWDLTEVSLVTDIAASILEACPEEDCLDQRASLYPAGTTDPATGEPLPFDGLNADQACTRSNELTYCAKKMHGYQETFEGASPLPPDFCPDSAGAGDDAVEPTKAGTVTLTLPNIKYIYLQDEDKKALMVDLLTRDFAFLLSLTNQEAAILSNELSVLAVTPLAGEQGISVTIEVAEYGMTAEEVGALMAMLKAVLSDQSDLAPFFNIDMMLEPAALVDEAKLSASGASLMWEAAEVPVEPTSSNEDDEDAPTGVSEQASAAATLGLSALSVTAALALAL